MKYYGFVVKQHSERPRSGCPVSISLERFGDRWSLLIIRDLMVRGYRTFHEFQHAGEGIATNILADRLRKLEAGGILTTEPAEDDGRSTHYRLTPKGIALAPVLLELLIWSARHEKTAAPCAFIDLMEQSRETVLAEVRRRWEERDFRPLIPPFRDSLPPSPTKSQRASSEKTSRPSLRKPPKRNPAQSSRGEQKS